MPSTIVHIGLAALLGTALLGEYFDTKSILIVVAIAAFPDLDTLIGLWIMEGAHRTVLHNLIFPLLALAVITWDVRFRERSYIKSQWGEYGVRVAWVSILGSWIIAHILLDAFYNGANLLWPLHDSFIDLSGSLLISDQRGLVQTFLALDWSGGIPSIEDESVRGTTEEMHYYTGFDPGPDADPDVERTFPIAMSGELFVVALSGYFAVAARLLTDRDD